VQSTLQQFKETDSQDSFSLQNSKLLRVRVDQVTIQSRLGGMVAYQGELKFEHAGSGGMSRMLKKAVTGEGTDLMKISGNGEVFLAAAAQDVHLLRLDSDHITCNGANVLAFDADIDWDIKRTEGVSGMLGGGFYTMELKGSGWVAVVSDGPPVMLDVSEKPTFVDPQAAITWSSGVTTQIKTDVNLKTLIGRASGETVQMAMQGSGWVLVQPSEGRVTATGANGGSGGGAKGLLGNVLGG
jgi:uncharacterized protein (AIM24 family)